jgi:hypothetical protein
MEEQHTMQYSETSWAQLPKRMAEIEMQKAKAKQCIAGLLPLRRLPWTNSRHVYEQSPAISAKAVFVVSPGNNTQASCASRLASSTPDLWADQLSLDIVPDASSAILDG